MEQGGKVVFQASGCFDIFYDEPCFFNGVIYPLFIQRFTRLFVSCIVPGIQLYRLAEDVEDIEDFEILE